MRSTVNTFNMIKRNKIYKEMELTESSRLGRWQVAAGQSGGRRRPPTSSTAAAQGDGPRGCRQQLPMDASSSTSGRQPPGNPTYRYAENMNQKPQRQLATIHQQEKFSLVKIESETASKD
jgi:hypothetical protein